MGLVTFSPAARAKVLELLSAEDRRGWGLRLSIAGRMGGAFQYRLAFLKPGDREPGDVFEDAGGFELTVDARSAPFLPGTRVEWVESAGESGFRIDNPNPLWTDPVALAVQRLFDDEINPALASHGGFVHLLEVRDGIAYVELGGGCQGCGMAHVTLQRGIEARVREAVPAVTAVVDSTDHAAGTSPYSGGAGRSPYA